MASDYIVSKWRLWFKVIDINHRGEISRSDVKDEEETFARLSHLNAKKKKDMVGTLDRLWEKTVFRGRSGAINEDQFVEMNTKHYTADKRTFQDEMKKLNIEFFTDVADVSHEGSINEKEYVNVMIACGHKDTALIKEVFALYNPVDGKVPLQVIIDSWVQFTSCDDSSKRDIVKEGFERCV